MTKYDELVNTKRNIFNVDDLVAIWSSTNRRDALESIKGYILRGKVFRIFKGIYSLNQEYNKFELAQKLFPPSYISYYSSLSLHGIIFQKYSDIHICASQSKNIGINDQKYVFHKLKSDVLLNTQGIQVGDNYMIASPERSICDSLYLNKDIAFDNLRNLDKDLLIKLSGIYKNKSLTRRVNDLIKLLDI